MITKKSIFDRLRDLFHLVAPLAAILLFGSTNPDPYPKDYFRSPLGIPLVLAGSFAEMRSNHFHSGLDIKTNGSTGYRIYAAAEGWITRISVAPGGFGNALYVEHPNGYMTVYAHLQRFSPEIDNYITNLQYARESFAVDAFPTRGRFPVAKGDVIAFSGNSGSSAGPHLHFEIRNVKNGWPENPLLFGLDVPDSRPPRIQRIKLYSMDEQSQIRIRDSRTGGWRILSGRDAVLLDVSEQNGVFQLSRADRVEASGRIGFGVQTYDNHDGSPNRLGAFEIDLLVDGAPLYAAKLESFSFDQTRYINAHVDYEEYVRHRRWIQRSYLLPGNSLPFYRTVEKGILNIDGGKDYAVEYRISDAGGNQTVLPFSIHGLTTTDTGSDPSVQPESSNLYVQFDEPFRFSTEGFSVRMPGGTVYDNTLLSYDVLEAGKSKGFGPVYRFHENGTPVQKAFSISLDAKSVPERIREKATLALVNDNGRLSYAGGTYSDGKVTGSVRTFGRFTISADSTAPTIRSVNISNGKNMARAGTIRLRIRDDFSGIRSFRGEIDGRWALFSYDAKTGTLTHSFDGRFGSGAHKLEMSVVDAVGNIGVYRVDFSL